MPRIPPIERFEAQAFKSQQATFCTLTLFVLAILLLLHTLFAPLLGEPSKGVLVVLVFSFLLKMLEISWLQSRPEGISERTARIETFLSGAGIYIIAGLLAFLTNRDDSPYFVLLAIPILQFAYLFGLLPTILMIVAAVTMMFAWIQHYFGIHGPPRPTQYLETGMIAVIFCIAGPMVWYLVNQLRAIESKLYQKMRELESAREKLAAEERLAAVGRLASGIAHEIRNPVAMISSSLATAAYPAAENAEREEMFAIAAREAKRLENLTGEFLSYARPAKPLRTTISVCDIVRHIADVTRMRAAERNIGVTLISDGEILADVDAAQMEGALLNLTLNALDATSFPGRIEMRIQADERMIYFEVENSGKRIPDSDLARVFEPFFTTKTTGTGLGLAIAREIAIAHGGDLWVSANQDGAVVFTMSVSRLCEHSALLEEAEIGKGSDC